MSYLFSILGSINRLYEEHLQYAGNLCLLHCCYFYFSVVTPHTRDWVVQVG